VIGSAAACRLNHRTGSGRSSDGPAAPADAFLAADAGAFAALGGQDIGVACVGTAPAEVTLQFPGLDGVAGVVGVGEGELPQWPEVCLDGGWPRRRWSG
jgi:hypothetical protein